MQGILNRINSPEDIKQLTDGELKDLCQELRDYIVEVCSHNPGHLASSLGTVEIITALHYVFNAPEDKIVFDVGHQAYAHKILTGRREAFAGMREEGGLSGFPNRDESPYDAFGTGHSSTSISAALGFAEAARLQGSQAKTVAVIGDGALTGGLAFEGINNAGDSNSDLLIILNDNNQSIDDNLGGLHNYLLKLTTNNAYNKVKDLIWDTMGETRTRSFFQRWVRSFKSWLVKGSGGDLFESLGFRYFGPVDGNDITEMVRSLEKLHNMKGPRVLHCLTVKGKGYAPAEADPIVWHAPGRFDPSTGERISSPRKADRYQDVFGQVLCELAAQDPRVVGVTPAMASGCGMSLLAQKMPKRFFDVGIEEEHAVTFSAGLAAGGMRPFCNIYSAFSQRAYDQIIHDVALQRLPVTLCFDRAGLVGEDGATHNGAFDMAAYRSIPGVTIVAPRNETELKRAMYTALQQNEGPYIIRYPRGMGEGCDWKNASYGLLEPGKAEVLMEGNGVAVVACGPAVCRAMEAAAQFDGAAGVYDFKYIKPLDTEMLDRIAAQYKAILTVEDGCMAGGLFGAVAEYIASHHPGITVKGNGIPDGFIPHARQARQREICGLDSNGIAKSLDSLLKKLKKDEKLLEFEK